MFLFLYSALVVVFWPLVLLGFVWRFGLRRTLNGIGERFGAGKKSGPATKGLCVWFHAASVGEVRAVEPLMRLLGRRNPAIRKVLTTSTLAGKELAQRLALADEVRLSPVDLPFCVNGLLSVWSPQVLVIIETELWPNWIHTVAAHGIPMVLVNGRLSNRSFKSYLGLRFFWRPLLERLFRVGAQSLQHRERFLRLGTPPETVKVTGNLKYDVPLPALSRRPEIFRRYGFAGHEKILVAGSTHGGEEEMLLNVFRSLSGRVGDLKMVIAPRHVDRVPEIERLLERHQLVYQKRSTLFSASVEKTVVDPVRHGKDVFILDTIGELPEIYGLASWAFVGGSLIPRGGQNPLEPARWGVPVLFGPHMDNFAEMKDLFVKASAGIQVTDPHDLENRLLELSQDPAQAGTVGARARELAESQGGALLKSLALIEEAMSVSPLKSR